MCRHVDAQLACEPLHGHHLAHRPPTPAQLDSLCAETAAIDRSWGWAADAISIQSVLTHADAASNRDGRVVHDNDGPVIWGGTGERWDLLQLEKGGPATGGEQLRARVQQILRGILRDGRAWCRVHEFAEEFGISVAYEPFALGERRGG